MRRDALWITLIDRIPPPTPSAMTAVAFDTIENVQVPCLLNSKIDNGRFHLIERLGQGGYSVVYLATDSHSCRPGSSNPSHVAIKCLLNTRKCKIVREVALHKRAASIPGVVKIFRTFEEGDLFFVVLEYCPHGDLFGVLTEEQLFLGRDRLIKSVFLQLLDTVAAMHKLGVYHRDLKPENILCASSPSMCNGQPTSLTVLVADFGLATESELSESFGCGSYVYMTPECLAGMYSRALPHYSSRAADIWALGVILVNLVCGRSPWKTALLSDPSFRRYIRDVRWLRQMLPLSMPAYHFLNKIFSNHGNRVAISDLRRQFAEIETFYMTREELAVADKTARLVAREWIPDTPIDDIRSGEVLKLHVNDIDERQLFEDVISSNKNTESDQTSTSGTDSSRNAPLSSSDEPSGSGSNGSLAAADASSGTSSGSSGFPITPPSKAVQPKEGVPDLPKDQQVGAENWVLSKREVHLFRKALSADAALREMTLL